MPGLVWSTSGRGLIGWRCGRDVEMPPRTRTGINRNVEQGWTQSLQFLRYQKYVGVMLGAHHMGGGGVEEGRWV